MAIVKGPFQLSGSIGNISFYTRRDSDKVIMRTKGGVNGKKMKRLPQFEGFRNQQKEWAGCTKLASGIRGSFWDIRQLADYNLTPVLNALANKMQKAAEEGEKGSRPVLLSDYRPALEGFNLNRKNPYNSVLRVSTTGTLDREQLSAKVTFDRMQPDNDLLNFRQLPYYRLLATLGTVSDMVAKPTGYEPVVPELHAASVMVSSEWMPASAAREAVSLELHMGDEVGYLTDDVTVVLSVGIEFGETGIDGKPAPVKYAGCGKVLKVR